MKKLFTLTRSLHTLFGNIVKRLGRPRPPKHALDSQRTDSTPLKTNVDKNSINDHFFSI